MSKLAIQTLEKEILNLEYEVEDLTKERDELAQNLQLALAQISRMKEERNYPILEAVTG